MWSWDYLRLQEDRGACLRRSQELRLDPTELKLLHGDRGVRAELSGTRMTARLPPVGTDVFRRLQRQGAAKGAEPPDRTNQQAPTPAVYLEAGKPLPFVYGAPPPGLLNKPLEELDPFYPSKKTFVALGRGNVVHRFNAEPSCFLLSPFNPIRAAAVWLLTHSFFHLFILMTILTNCVFMTWKEAPAWSEFVFIAVYALEVLVKVASRGFCVGCFTFLRDPWNWLDVLVLSSAFLSFVDLGKFSALTVIPRVLKLMAVYPGVKGTAGALVQSLKNLAGAFVLTLSVLWVWAVFGLHLFMGTLRQKCVRQPNIISFYDFSNDTFDFSAESLNWHPDHNEALLCGNQSDASVCPKGFTCLEAGLNPQHGLSHFDSFGASLLEHVRILYQDFWEDLFLQMLKTSGVYCWIYLLFVLPSFFCVLSLFLSALASATAAQHQAVVSEAKRREDEFLQIQEVVKKRPAEQKSFCTLEFTEPDSGPQIMSQETQRPAESPRWCVQALRWNCCGCWRSFKLWLSTLILNPFFDLGVVLCLVLNIVFMSTEHYPMSFESEELLSVSSVVFTGIFAAEMLLRLLATDPYDFFRVGWNIFDVIVVVQSLVVLSLAEVENLSVLRLFSVMRLLRLGRWWPSLRVFLKIVWTTLGSLRNLTLILVTMIFMFAVVGLQMFHKDYSDHVCRFSANCKLPRWHMQELFHSFLLVFRVLCGEWIETLWDCMAVSGQASCLVFFLVVLVVGQLLVLVLFLALLLSSLRVPNLGGSKDQGEKNLKKAIDQIKVGVAWTRTWMCGSKQEESHKEEDKAHESGPGDCCCPCCYRCCPYLDVDQGNTWSNFRRTCFSITQHKFFEAFIIFVIVLSSAILVFEDVLLQRDPFWQNLLDILDLVFTLLFFLEMIFKLVSLGFRKYFSSVWCWIDFLILAVSALSTTLCMLGYAQLGAGLSVRSLRTLRPLRTLSRFGCLRVVLQALLVSLPSMLDVLLVSLFIWLVFSLVGVRLLAGKLFHCINETSQELYLTVVVDNKTECLSLESPVAQWRNNPVNFDSVPAGFLSLLMVATFKGWMGIMYSAVDSRWVESQPAYENNLSMFLYFGCFVVIGRFFTFNLFIRAFLNTLDRLRHKFAGKHVFMTDEQLQYSDALRKWFSTKPVPPPKNRCQALLFDLVTRPCFEVVMVTLICGNVLPLMLDTNSNSMQKDLVLFSISLAFILVFLAEFFLKMVALRQFYFFNVLNVVDFLVLLGSIAGLFVADFMSFYFFPAHLLALLRLGRVARLVLSSGYAGGTRKLLSGFLTSLPALFNICLLLFVVMFTYSVFGMFTFAGVQRASLINDRFNFETFLGSLLSMFVITTTAGWDGLLIPVMDTPPGCDEAGSAMGGACSRPALGVVFFTSYILLSLLLVLLMYLAVFLETFRVDQPLGDEHLQMFHQTWRKFDPEDSELIHHSQLSDFCDALQEPLRIPKPNSVQLVLLDLPLLPGDKLHLRNVVLALAAKVFSGDSGRMETFRARVEEKFKTKASSEPISSTLQKRREEAAAAAIQRWFRKRLVKARDAEGAEPAPGV